MNTITESQWLQELEQLGVLNPNLNDAGLTTDEWMAQWKCKIDKARHNLRKLNSAGLLNHGKRSDVNIRGQAINRIVYGINREALARLKEEKARSANVVAKGQGNPPADRKRR